MSIGGAGRQASQAGSQEVAEPIVTARLSPLRTAGHAGGMSGSDDAVDRRVTDTVGDVLGVVPRFVERTRCQAEIASTLLSLLGCATGRRSHADNGDAPHQGAPEHERVDILSVLEEEGPSPDPVPAPVLASVPAPPPAPVDASTLDEAELPIQDYDSLAASQVVPRLATLDHDALTAVQRYELATRNRQTILHRVAQLLSA